MLNYIRTKTFFRTKLCPETFIRSQIIEKESYLQQINYLILNLWSSVFAFRHINKGLLIIFITASTSYLFDFGKCHFHACFVLIKVLNISQVTWFDCMVDFSTSSNTVFRGLIVVLTDFEIRCFHVQIVWKVLVFEYHSFFFRSNPLRYLYQRLHILKDVLFLLLIHMFLFLCLIIWSLCQYLFRH